jgi:hypothetical protein
MIHILCTYVMGDLGLGYFWLVWSAKPNDNINCDHIKQLLLYNNDINLVGMLRQLEEKIAN